MCKTRFGSQGVILYGFKAKQIEKTFIAFETPSPPLMAKVMKNDHFFIPPLYVISIVEYTS